MAALRPRAAGSAAGTGERIEEFLRRRFGAGPHGARVEALSGDASARRYFRVCRERESFVLVVYPDGSLEAQMAFLEIRTQLEGWGLPVPRLVEADSRLGLMLLEDLGDVTLQARLEQAGEEEREALYRQAIDQLLRMQREARRAKGGGTAFGLAFDVEKLVFELRFFETHFLAGLRGLRLGMEEREALGRGFLSLAEEIASWERVLCHRDYHSRNLMWRAGTLHWVDFQDARLGPVTYDLASLLRDSYVELPEDFVAARLQEFRVAAAPAEDPESFARRFELTCLQRNLKALGTFGHQTVVGGNPAYLEYVPRTLRHVGRNLVRHPELAGLHEVLERHLEEYRA